MQIPGFAYLLALCGAAIGAAAHKLLEGWIVEKVLRMLNPYEEVLISYGIPIAVAISSVLFLHRFYGPKRLAHSATPTGRPIETAMVIERERSQPEFIPLTEAANISYERLRQAGSIYATAADKLGYKAAHESRVDAALNWFNYFLIPKLNVYGKHPPSRLQELIDRAEFKRGGLEKLGTEFWYYGENEPRYIDLRVRKDAVEKLVSRIIDGDEKAFEDGFSPPTKEKALLRLTKLRNDGIVIRNSSSEMLFTSHLEKWTSDVREWMNEVISTLRHVDEKDSEWFKVLGEVPPARVPVPNVRLGGQADRDAFIAVFRQHDYRLARLDGLLKKYRVGA